MPVVAITKAFKFEAAHVLPMHPGKCSRVHGHSYRLEVTVSGPLQDDGMILDFDALSERVHQAVVDRLDHRMLNDLIENPTVELVALACWDWLIAARVTPSRLTLHETATNSATVTP